MQFGNTIFAHTTDTTPSTPYHYCTLSMLRAVRTETATEFAPRLRIPTSLHSPLSLQSRVRNNFLSSTSPFSFTSPTPLVPPLTTTALYRLIDLRLLKLQLNRTQIAYPLPVFTAPSAFNVASAADFSVQQRHCRTHLRHHSSDSLLPLYSINITSCQD